MRTRTSADNPHGPTRHGFAWEQIPPGGRAHLDYGCGDASFLDSLRRKGIGRLVGADVAAGAIARARARCPNLEIHHVAAAGPLPFEEGAFSSISLLDVLEHVDEQVPLLRELARVLADDGVLVVTVPRRHVFSALDMGNLKFRFPRLHRWFYCLTHSREAYERRYVANPDGLIGDISARKAWHQHFSEAELADLLALAGFEVVRFDGSALFTRPMLALLYLPLRPRPLQRLADPLYRLDARWFRSMNLFALCRKRRAGPA